MPGSTRTPRYVQAAETVRARIADGTLRPGAPAPSGAALARVTGFNAITCRKALELLIMDGTLRACPSPNARARVAGDDPARADPAARAAALSAALAGRRHAAGVTQLELAGITGYAVTTVGHAETGRLWQSRAFWEAADKALNAGGELLGLHDDYRAALTRPAGPTPAGTSAATAPAVAAAPPRAATAPALAAAPVPAPVVITITWPDGATSTIRQPGGLPESGPPASAAAPADGGSP